MDLKQIYSLRKIKLYNCNDCSNEWLSNTVKELLDQDEHILAKHQVRDLSEIASLELGASNFAFYFRINKAGLEQHSGIFVAEQLIKVK